MKRFGIIMVMLLFVGLLFAQEEAKKHQYVGVDKCKTCHKGPKKGEQFEKWSASKHAKAYETLKGEEAAKIAKEKGIKVPAYEAPECLKCHVTGYGEDPSLFTETFKMEDGVQCEACHGAGSDYRSMKVMKDYELSVQNGMRPIKVADGSAEKLCVTCHNEESPTFKGFDFKKMWAEIAHNIPAEK